MVRQVGGSDSERRRRRYGLEMSLLHEMLKPRRFRTAYQLHRRYAISPCQSEGKGAVQYFRDDCDVNKIMERWTKTGQVTHVNRRTPLYGDFSNATGYQDALLRVQEAQEMFANLPVKARDLAGNDPAKFLEMVQNEENREMLEALGVRVDGYPEEDNPAAASAAAAGGSPAPRGAAGSAREGPRPGPLDPTGLGDTGAVGTGGEPQRGGSGEGPREA